VIWFTADWHLDHYNIIRYCDRPFRNAHEMNGALLLNALEVVGPNDTLYVLGDFAFGRDVYDAYAAALNWHCQTVFLRGNHDAKQADTDGLAAEMKHNKRRYYLCHYPWSTWRPNTVMLHGHSHGNHLPPNADSRLRMRFDVGVDTVWDGRRYYPVSVEQVEAKIHGTADIHDRHE